MGGGVGNAFRSDKESNSQTEIGEAVIAFQVRLEVFMCLLLTVCAAAKRTPRACSQPTELH